MNDGIHTILERMGKAIERVNADLVLVKRMILDVQASQQRYLADLEAAQRKFNGTGGANEKVQDGWPQAGMVEGKASQVQ